MKNNRDSIRDPKKLDLGKHWDAIEQGRKVRFIACNKLAMRYWALQYGEYAEILEPESLRDDIRDVVDCMASFYR